MRKFCFVFLLLCLSALSVSAAETVGVVSAEGVSIIDSDGKTIGTLKKGQQVTITGDEDNYYLIQLTAKVQKKALEVSEQASSKSAPLSTSGFEFSDIRFKSDNFFTEIIGTIRNTSNKSYSMAMFNVNIYSPSDELLLVHQMLISNIQAKSSKTFSSQIFDDFPGSFKYSIQFDSGY